MTDGQAMWMIFAAGAIVGCAFAQWLTNKRWRDNADEVMRVHSGGRLYKVVHDADYVKANKEQENG